jgi:hypothetical protein
MSEHNLGDYLHKQPEPGSIPPGRVLVHNPVYPVTCKKPGTRGSRLWTQELTGSLEVCGCGWRPELGTHYRHRAEWEADS